MSEVTVVGAAAAPGPTATPAAPAAPAAHAAPAETTEVPVLHLVRPLPGFADLDRFALVRLDHAADDADAGNEPAAPKGDEPAGDVPGGGPAVVDPTGLLFELRSLQAPDVRFLVAVPAAFFPDYVVELDDETVQDLGIVDASDVLMLVVLTTGDDTASTTANLLAPVVVNARNRSAAQVILSGTDWPVRATVA